MARRAMSSEPALAPAVPAIPPRRMAVLFLVMLVAAAGNTAMQSILPALGTRIGIGDVWVSLAFSWSALLWVLTAPYWARSSDKRGRKALMALGLSGFIASMLLCGIALHAGLEGWIGAATTFAVFALFRSLYGGLGSAAPPAVQAYVAARTEAGERTKALSLIASSFGLGTVIGPTVAPYFILPGLGLAGPMFAFAAIGLGVLIALRLTLPDDTPRFAARGRISAYPSTGDVLQPGDDDGTDAEDADTLAERAGARPERIGWLDPRVRSWNIAGLAGGNAQAMLLGVIGFLILDRLGLRPTPELAAAPTGQVLWVGALATLLAQWGLIPLLSMAPRTSIVAGSIVGGIGALMVGFAHNLPAISSGFAIAMLGFGLLRPGFTAGASLAVPRRLQGQVAGQTASINGAAYIISPALGVALYSWHAELTFLLIGTLTFSLAIWGWRGLRAPA